jgi:hypothetical protein
MDFMELACVFAFEIRRRKRKRAILGASINYTTFTERAVSQTV